MSQVVGPIAARWARLSRIRPRRGRLLALLLLLLLLLLSGSALFEVRTSALQSWLLSRYAAQLSYTIGEGASPRVIFPESGPLDLSRGYAGLPEFQRRLMARGYSVTEQALIAPAMAKLAQWGIPLPYREPPLVGLVLRDARGRNLYDARVRFRDEQFQTFDDIPPLILDALLFIENRELGEVAGARANPAVDWKRFAKAGLLFTGSKLGLSIRMEGGSTLATQLEKYRHSPSGRTGSAADKMRQMMSASLKAYQGGPDTREVRREIVLDYLNTMPLAGVPGYGEVNGLGEGLRAWFGMDLDRVCSTLQSSGVDETQRARAFKHVLALLYAVHAPSYFLTRDRPALEAKVAAYTSLLHEAGVIDARLRHSVAETPLRFAKDPIAPVAPSTTTFDPRRKLAGSLRAEMMELLGVPGLYALDRLDLEIDTTLDSWLQDKVSRLFRDLKDPDFLDANGLRGQRLLSEGDPSRVVYSMMLFERTPRGNLLRVRADSLDQPFDVNEGMKMELGSTAKLRTLSHYLEIVTQLHRELSALDSAALDRRATEARDAITTWAIDTMRSARGISVGQFLDRAMQRSYSASPAEVFFTGGGVHSFGNFDPDDDARVLTVREGVVRSTNLVFIRLMRDLVRFHEARLPYDTRAVLAREDRPERERLLSEIGDDEARLRLAKAFREYHGLEPGEIPARLLGADASSPRHLAILYYAWRPGGDPAGLSCWLSSRGAGVSDDETRRLAARYGDRRLTLEDYGFLLRKPPLDLWCAGELTKDPQVALETLLARSGPARESSSRWLLKPGSRAAQDRRLRIRFERDAFARMTPAWRRAGFPFEHLVPSLATAIGSSADRPAALADLMGIILNDGERAPDLSVRQLRFAAGTPYHTLFEPATSPDESARVLPAAVARVLKSVLAEVVERGTAQRVKDLFIGPDGAPLVVGGKTGSGDNRFETFAAGGKLMASRAVSRTGAFAFYIGDRYFGVITASVSGPEAGTYRFTSSLPLSILGLLAPAINERLAPSPPTWEPRPARAALAAQASRL